MSGTRWWARLAAAAVAFAAVEGVVAVIDAEADELRLALVIGLVVCAIALLLDVTQVGPAAWSPRVEQESGLGRLDPRTASYVRILESHHSAREADTGLRTRLRELAGQSLRARHDVALTEPAAADLLGPELYGVLTGPARRLRTEEIERCVRRIEEL